MGEVSRGEQGRGFRFNQTRPPQQEGVMLRVPLETEADPRTKGEQAVDSCKKNGVFMVPSNEGTDHVFWHGAAMKLAGEASFATDPVKRLALESASRSAEDMAKAIKNADTRIDERLLADVKKIIEGAFSK